MRVILLIMVGLSLLQANYIRDDSKEVVLDTTTNLLWQDDNAVISLKYTWTNAITQCENLNLGGYDDWRLPSFNELYALIDKNTFNPAMSSVFLNVQNTSYWSSTTYARNITNAWDVYFNHGGDGVGLKTDTSYVRCVR